MAYTRTMNGKVPQVLQELHFDETPTPGSLNAVTSGGVAEAVDAAKDEMQGKIDEVTLDPSAVALGNVHLLDEVTLFAADAKILVDSATNGPGAMSKDNLEKQVTKECLQMKGTSVAASVTDADNAPIGSIIWCQSSNNVANTPLDGAGLSHLSGNLLTFSQKSTYNTQYVSQVFFTTGAAIYTRFKKYGGTWTDWLKQANASDVFSLTTLINSKTAQNLNMIGDNVDLSLTDADNAPFGVCFCNQSDVSNLPTDYSGLLFTYGKKANNTNQYVTQLYTSSNAKAYVRFKKYGGTWTAWSTLAYSSDLAVYSGLMDALNYPDLSMFPRVGVIGDSYASALLYNAQGSSEGTRYPISWPQILGRKTGSTWINFTRGGLSTRSWLTDSDHGLADLESEDPCDLYVLVLGINDMAISSYLGSITDITSHESYTDYPDTFYGNYGKIFEQILEHAPASKIIFSTMANNVQGDSSSSGAFNAAIIEIAEHYGVPVVKQYEDSFFKSTIYTAMYGAHPTKAGQAGMATAFERMICKCVASNLTYFNSFDGES